MKHELAVATISCLLLCLVGCAKHIKESSLIGSWQFDANHSIMVLDANHAYTLKGDDSRTTLGEWRLDGHRFITVGQTWTNQSAAIRVSVTNDTRITELILVRVQAETNNPGPCTDAAQPVLVRRQPWQARFQGSHHSGHV